MLSRRFVTEEMLGIGTLLAMPPVAARLLFNGVTLELFFRKIRHVTSICLVISIGSAGCSFLTISSSRAFSIVLLGLLGEQDDGIYRTGDCVSR